MGDPVLGRTRRQSGRGPALWALTLAFAATGCSSDRGGADIPPVDPDLITVFFPVDGLVRGRALPGALPTSVQHVSIEAQPTGTSSLRTVDEDGGFTFSIVAISGDLLEIAGSRDENGSELGAPVYIEVPPTRVSFVDYVCCQPRGTCQSRSEADRQAELLAEDPNHQIVCPEPVLATSCNSDADCGTLEGEYLTIDLDRVTVSKPNERGRISVSGFVEPNALVTIENRGLNGIGVPGPRYRSAQISNDIGAFEVDDLQGKGDDEIVLQVLDLNGFKSPPISRLVPDADLAGVDVIGAFAWEPLTNGDRGPISVHVAPWGVDERGLCPDGSADPQLCFTGGLDYSMVSIQRAEMQVGSGPIDLQPTKSSTSAERPYVRGLEGDVRAGPQDVMIVLDHSEVAETKDAGGAAARRFTAARRFVQGLRRRDRVGLVTYAQNPILRAAASQTDPGLKTFEDRGVILDALSNVAQEDPGQGNDLFAAIQTAAAALRRARSERGRIVVIAADGPAGTDQEALVAFGGALDALDEDLARGDPTIALHFVGLDILDDTPNMDLVDDLATFTDGRVYRSTINGVEQTLTEVRSFLSGSFILLYDIFVPVEVGKSGTIELDLEVLIGGQTAQASYTGPIIVQNSSNN